MVQSREGGGGCAHECFSFWATALTLIAEMENNCIMCKQMDQNECICSCLCVTPINVAGKHCDRLHLP